jgi:hypothetical protein
MTVESERMCIVIDSRAGRAFSGMADQPCKMTIGRGPTAAL